MQGCKVASPGVQGASVQVCRMLGCRVQGAGEHLHRREVLGEEELLAEAIAALLLPAHLVQQARVVLQGPRCRGAEFRGIEPLL